ncbi:MAG: hypothetical protein KGI93_02570 [Acidobacteriota bacterium]|nr:hypothetical protein [Acidobacteriota bacterium]MDE3190579.1 hypothetical protein [Acidobacteriota bacterium]
MLLGRLFFSTALAALVGLVVASAVSATSAPSGEVTYGNSSFDVNTQTFVGGGGTIEPAYDDTTGTLVYLQTPNHAFVHPPADAKNVAPLYLVVYPAGSIDPASLNCAHLPADNCPDHGNIVAGAAEAINATVYGRGVAGHDHLVGIASTGGDFNIVWEPVLVLFNSTAAVHHITTLGDLASSDVTEIPLPALDFHCSSVSAAAYDRGTPAPTVPGP